MATNAELEKKLKQLEEQNKVMAQMLGLSPVSDAEDITERADHIKFGSPEHAQFLGLIEVSDGDMEDAKTNEYILYESPNTGTTWRLEDEVSPFMAFPNPDKIAKLYLRQKISSLESGPPPVPADAPPLLVPQTAFQEVTYGQCI